jgi:16S rRNA (adenine1518-N6/adenine1519-N6)-dimethyltransferase
MIKAKKSLGQNFLKDAAVLQRIVESANLSKEDRVIEIGPGQGALTELLAQKCKKVVAIELDDRLIEMLRSKLRNKENIEIIHGDILKINLPELVSEYEEYKVVANIPYYITAPIIRLLLETEYPPKEMILMVQKEVAERICAQAGKMSILAVSVQYYAQPKYLFDVPREAFEPKPKVDSAVIKITAASNQQSVISKNTAEDTKKFFRIVKAGFSAKRKTLANNLSNGLLIDKKKVEEKLNTIMVSPPKADQPRAGKNIRAQELGIEDWIKLGDLL